MNTETTAGAVQLLPTATLRTVDTDEARAELAQRRDGTDCGCGWGDYCEKPEGGGRCV